MHVSILSVNSMDMRKVRPLLSLLALLKHVLKQTVLEISPL